MAPVSRRAPPRATPKGFGRPAPKPAVVAKPKPAPSTPKPRASSVPKPAVLKATKSPSPLARVQGWAKQGAAATKGAIDSVKSQAAEVKKLGLRAAAKKGTAALRDGITNPKGNLDTFGGKFGLAKTFGGAVYQAATLPGKIQTASREVRAAAKSRSRDDIARAVKSTSAAVSGGIQTVHKGAVAAVAGHKLVSSYRAAEKAFRAAAPKASKAVTEAAARAAAKNAFAGGTKQAGKHAVEAAARLATKQGSTLVKGIAGSGSRAVAKAVVREGSEAAAKAALRAGARVGGTALAKAAGRFAPGVNVAVAALDVAQAAATLADSKAGVGKKVTASITALGSVAAATNIPIVSQVGAGVSLVSSVVGGFFK